MSTTDSHTIELEQIDDHWRKYFRYDSVYTDQQKGINEFLDILKDKGFYSLEGACGTGKTLIGITGALYAMRSGSHPEYEETCVLTPNKQQLKQFVEEMKGVNESLPHGEKNAKTVVMKGKTDMIPWAFTDIPPFDSGSIHDRSDKLRRQARTIMSFESDIPLNWPNDMSPPDSARYNFNWDEADQDQIKRKKNNSFDPIRAKAVVKILSNKADYDQDYEKLVVDGVETPYPDVVPHTNHIVNKRELDKQGKSQIPELLQGKFDPFYIGFHAEGNPSFGFRNAENSVFDRDTLFEMAASQGVCPHEAMAHFGKKAEFVLGNYMHIFDPKTRSLSVEKMDLLGEDTIVILDEAHRIESKVRDMLSDTLDLYTLDKCINDLEYTEAYFSGNYANTPNETLSPKDIKKIKEFKQEAKVEDGLNGEVTETTIREVRELFEFIKTKLLELAADHLAEEHPGGWMKKLDNGNISDEEKPLSSPELPDTDDILLKKVKARFDNGEERMESAVDVYKTVNDLFSQLEDAGIHTRDVQDVSLGLFCYNWVHNDPIDYHRELRLEKSIKDKTKAEYPQWVQGWTPYFQLFNCIPTTELIKVFSSVGAGLLMSATLSPPEAFQSAVGVDSVPKKNLLDPESEEESDNDTEAHPAKKEEVKIEEPPRESKFSQFPLRFPRENRNSIIVDVEKYTAGNRGGMTQKWSDMRSTRKKYANIIKDICTSHGNVMICMPKYSEAKWAYNFLSDTIEKDCHLDQSSTNKETNQMLDSFFEEGSHNVVFTSTRGTITEGVDYDGDKLHCCAVIGIPLIDTRPDRIDAIKHAYSKKIHCDSGFNTAIKIPAVRKSRQAIGRVLRGADEVGVRILVDERYGSTEWDGANKYLSKQEQEEFRMVPQDNLADELTAFWQKNS